VNLEELVRAALTTQASAEPEEAGAYDRFLRHRRRRAWQAVGSAGLAVAVVLGLVVGGAWLLGGRQRGAVTGPTPLTGPVRYPRQGFELTACCTRTSSAARSRGRCSAAGRRGGGPTAAAMSPAPSSAWSAT
jgi:hypothetical protein